MSSVFTEVADPVEITWYARQVFADLEEANPLNTYLPRLEVEDVEFTIESLNTLTVALGEYRAFDAAGKIIDREFGQTAKTSQLAPITAKRVMGERDRIRQRANAENALVAQAYNDVEAVVNAVYRRILLAQGEVIDSAILDLSEGGVIANIDWGDSASRKSTAGTAWTDTTNATAMQDMVDITAAYTTLNGFAPGAAYMSTTTLGLFRKNAEVRASVNVDSTRPSARLADVQAELAAEGLPPIVQYDTLVGATRVLPEGSVHLMPPAEFVSGNTVYGIPAEIGTTVDIQGSDRPGIVASSETLERPIRIETEATALVMPAVQPDRFYNFTR